MTAFGFALSWDALVASGFAFPSPFFSAGAVPFPLDFFVEIIPVPFLDEHYRSYQLVPALPEGLDEILETEV